MTHQDENKWAMLCHLSALLGYLVPLGNLLGPLIVWKTKGKEALYIDQQGKESLNFQLNVCLWFVISVFLLFFIIGFFILPLIGTLNLIMIIIASISAYRGDNFRYPFCVRFIT